MDICVRVCILVAITKFPYISYILCDVFNTARYVIYTRGRQSHKRKTVWCRPLHDLLQPPVYRRLYILDMRKSNSFKLYIALIADIRYCGRGTINTRWRDTFEAHTWPPVRRWVHYINWSLSHCKLLITHIDSIEKAIY